MDHKLSETEQYLWNFIEHHILEIPNYSIVKLSEQAMSQQPPLCGQ